VPSDTFVDLSSMMVNCILGQNDPWVKACQVGYITSNRPSFHSSRLGSEAYYKYVKRLAGLNIGGISNPVINHKQCNGSDAVNLMAYTASILYRKRKFQMYFS
jgi:hypothetical protein